MTTLAPWSSAPDADRWGHLESICAPVNDHLLDVANEILPLDSLPLPNSTLAAYRRAQARSVRELVPRLRAARPPDAIADDWSRAIDGLQDWAAWADRLAEVLERADGSHGSDPVTVDQSPHPGLEQFRTLFEWGSCSLLLDVN